MKKISLYIITALLGLLFFSSCDEKDYAEPTFAEPIFELPVDAELITIEDLKAIYNKEYPADRSYTSPVDRSNKYQNAEQFMTVEDDVYISGYVISDDQEGNFYKALVIQPDITGSSEGISISIGESSLYTKFAKGQKIFVKCKGLTLGKYGNEIQLGGSFSFYKYRTAYEDRPAMKEYRLASIASPSIHAHIFNHATPVSLDPKPVTIAEVLANESYKFTYLELKDVQFDKPGVTWGKQGGDHNDAFPFNTDVNIIDQNGDRLPLFTSNFSKFSHELITDKSGSIKGVLSYHSGNPQFVVNSLADVNMDDSRFNVAAKPIEGEEDVVYDFRLDFSGQNDLTDFSLDGWLNFSEKGSHKWFVQKDKYSENIYASCSNYNTGDAEMISWLISPLVDATSQKYFALFTGQHHWAHADDESPIEIFYSEDFDGTDAGVVNATWLLLSVSDIANESTKDWSFVRSEHVALPLKNIHIAVKYSATKTKTTGYLVDEIRVLKK